MVEQDRESKFRQLFDEEFDWVCYTLQRLGVHRRDLEDTAQEMFVSVFAHLPELEGQRPTRAWLAAFARRTAANYRRLARHRESPADDGFDDVPNAAGERVDDSIAARTLVQRALEELDFDGRTLIVLCDIEGRTAPELATMLEVPVDTVYARLHAARRRFTAAVHRLLPGGIR